MQGAWFDLRELLKMPWQKKEGTHIFYAPCCPAICQYACPVTTAGESLSSGIRLAGFKFQAPLFYSDATLGELPPISNPQFFIYKTEEQ